jgi:hypothetical protein
LTVALLLICAFATDTRAEPDSTPAPPAVRELAERVAVLIEAGVKGGRVRACGAEGSWNVIGLDQQVREIGAAADSYQDWKQAHRIKYTVQMAHGSFACDVHGPDGENLLLIEPDVEAEVLAALDSLIAAIGVDHPGQFYFKLPANPYTPEGMLDDLIDVFEGTHPEDFNTVAIAEMAAELRPLIYAPALTPHRFLSELLPPLVALQEALNADTALPARKREELLLKVEFTIRYFEYRGRWSLC